MENASKALLMAGGVLIGITLLSMMVYFFSSSARNCNQLWGTYDSKGSR